MNQTIKSFLIVSVLATNVSNLLGQTTGDALLIDASGNVNLANDLNVSGQANVPGGLNVSGWGYFGHNIRPTNVLYPPNNNWGLWIGANWSGGYGEVNFINIPTPGNDNKAGFTFDKYVNGVYQRLVTFQGDGNVGIGTGNPQMMLDVNGTFNAAGAATLNSDLTVGGNINGTNNFLLNKKFALRDDGGTVYLYPWGSGYESNVVVVGGGKPTSLQVTQDLTVAGTLKVNGSQCYYGGLHGRFMKSGNGDTYNGSYCSWTGIQSAKNVAAEEFDAYSDIRIKKDFKKSNSLGDLQVLNKLQVTDYKYVDFVQYGSQFKKGFIAQEVERVFPEAVKTHEDFIPNIFSVPQKVELRSEHILITMNKEHNLVDGDIVKFITAHGEETKKVFTTDKYTFSIADSTVLKYDSVFVYGKLVGDFRMIDYDRIFTLNVSVTQELSKELDSLQKENEMLKMKNLVLEKRMKAEEDIMTKMEARLDAVEDKVGVSKKTAGK